MSNSLGASEQFSRVPPYCPRENGSLNRDKLPWVMRGDLNIRKQTIRHKFMLSNLIEKEVKDDRKAGEGKRIKDHSRKREGSNIKKETIRIQSKKGEEKGN